MYSIFSYYQWLSWGAGERGWDTRINWSFWKKTWREMGGGKEGFSQCCGYFWEREATQFWNVTVIQWPEYRWYWEGMEKATLRIYQTLNFTKRYWRSPAGKKLRTKKSSCKNISRTGHDRWRSLGEITCLFSIYKAAGLFSLWRLVACFLLPMFSYVHI